MSANNVKQAISSWSSPTITLGSAVTGFNTVGSQIDDQEFVRYFVVKSNGDWQENEGVYTSSGTTLTRVNTLRESVSGTVTELPGSPFAPTSSEEVLISPSALGGVGPHRDGCIGTNVMRPPGTGTYGFTGDVPITDRLYCIPFYLPEPMTISRFGMNVATTSAGGISLCAIYDTDENLYPNIRVTESVSLSHTSSGLVTGTLTTPVLLEAGKYYTASVCDNNTVRVQAPRNDSEQNATFTGNSASPHLGSDVYPYYDTITSLSANLGTPDGYETRGRGNGLYIG